ncbi:MAG: iron ABC transporter permease [bacterium]
MKPIVKSEQVYEKITRKKIFFIILAVLSIVLLFLTDIMTGPAMLPMKDVVIAILQPKNATDFVHTIVWTFRLPIAIMALLIGSTLAIAGAEMQTILNNPLASPYTLGISSAASFGAAIAIILGIGKLPLIGQVGISFSAFIFALLAMLCIYGIAKFRKGTTQILILTGVALSFLFNSAVAFMQYIASEEQLQSIVFWMFGSLQGATWQKLGIISTVMVVGIPFFIINAWKLTALRLGDIRAQSLGINVQSLRLNSLVFVSILTATAVCFTGTIAFIGLVGPHLARFLVGEDQRFFLPMSGLLGAILLSVASILSKLIIHGGMLPIGITTSLFGVPFFIIMILSKKREYW